MKLRLHRIAILGIALSTAAAGNAAAGGSDRDHDHGQRGRHRATELVVNTTADTTDADLADGRCRDATGKCSLRAAVQTANARSGTFEIELRRGTYQLSIPGTAADGAEAGDLDITGRVEMEGKGAVIDLAGLGDRAFDVAAGADVSIEKLTVRNARPAAGESGGAFRNAGSLELSKITATGNVVEGTGASGGAILNTGDLRVHGSWLAGNSASRAGGAIEASGGRTVVAFSTMADNTTGAMPGNGGALHLTGEGYVEVDRSWVTSNVAAAEGGGLWNSATGTMIVNGSVITGNTANGVEADQGGGGLFNDGGAMSVSWSKVTDNTAPAGSGSGGGILNNLGDLDVKATDIRGNSAQRAGGGVETVNGTVTIDKSTLSSNTTGPAPGNGGAVHASGTAAIVDVTRSAVTDNVAALEGGGLWAGAGDSVMTVRRSTISGNVAHGADAINGGGGLFNKGGSLVVEHSTIESNSATTGSGSGGGILNLGTLQVSDTRIHANSAPRAGGGIESNDVNGAGDATLAGVRLTGNTTGSAPGNGGGMHVTGASITTVIADSTVTGNSAANEGGGLWNFAGATMTVTGSTVVDNTAPIGPNVFQNGDGGNFTVDGALVPAGPNDLAFP